MHNINNKETTGRNEVARTHHMTTDDVLYMRLIIFYFQKVERVLLKPYFL